MGLLGAIKSGLGKVARGTLTVVTYPVVKPTEILMNTILKNALLSILKGLTATVLAALGAFAATPASSNDAVTALIWGSIITAIHALQTVIQHATMPAAKVTAVK